MKKYLIYLLIFSLVAEIILPFAYDINAQEMPSFSIDFGDNSNNTNTNTTEPVTVEEPVAETTPAETENTPEPINTVYSEPNASNNTQANNIPQSITTNTTLSSTTKKEYHGGSNRFQTIRRNFSSKPKSRQTVSIDEAIVRSTTLSNSVFVATESSPKNQKKIIANNPVHPTSSNEKITAIDNVELFSGDVQVASADEIDMKTVVSSPIIKKSKAQPKPKSTIKAQSIKKIEPIKRPQLNQQNINSFDPINEWIKNMPLDPNAVQITTKPKAFQYTTLSPDTDIDASMNKFQWAKNIQSIWTFINRLFQLFVVGWLLILLYEKHSKSFGIWLIGHKRRSGRKQIKENKSTKETSPQIIEFECRRIRTMIPDRPYYQLFYGRPTG